MKNVDSAGELCAQGVQDVFVLCERAELVRYRVPCLLECYARRGLRMHHLPFPDGGAPELQHCTRILDELQHCLHAQRRTVIHCYGGLGRSGLIAACLLLQLSVSMTPAKAIEILRELRGGGAIQTVKQYNFLHEFREKFAAYQETKESRASERSGVQDVFVLCERAELVRYRVPCLLECYARRGLRVHHLPFPDGGAPELQHCTRILDELQHCLHAQRRTVIHCYGGLGRSGLIAACLLLQLSVSMTPAKAIEILRELRGGGAIQTVKQYNFLHEFREKFAAYQETKESRASERSVSR
ncbi:hypothetical protein PDJAM_G00259650 [Pangasius djambal]|nr:hypothetical protein [Pangasius djambal]